MAYIRDIERGGKSETVDNGNSVQYIKSQIDVSYTHTPFSVQVQLNPATIILCYVSPFSQIVPSR